MDSVLLEGAVLATVDESEKARLIVPMQDSSIQRIVAGQAVTDLASAVKELVDNALDAGAKSINIRLFNQGIDIVEVSDDGCGVPLSSRPFMAVKHATSKIRSFEDIYLDHRSLGFRGEALFCLANLSKQLVVATRTDQDVMGQKLQFRQDGTLDTSKVCPVARKIGTTVAVVQLFHALPVRRADLIKRIKTQRAKLVSMIQGYGILCLGVRFNLLDIVGNNGVHREDVKMCTSSSTRVEQTVSSVLGSRFLSGMTRISIDLTPALSDFKGDWKVEGLVSKAPALTARDGSVAREAQFFSINGRPVELPKVSRVLGDAWRSLDGTKRRPACVLCFTLPNAAYDVNLSPDKREVLLTQEEAICELIQAAIGKVWSSQSDGMFAENEVDCVVENKRLEQELKELGLSEARPLISAHPERIRARRRNAFVHDFRNAQLQHEAPEIVQNDTYLDEKRYEEIQARTRVALSHTQEPQLHDISEEINHGDSPTTSTDRHLSSNGQLKDRPSDGERLLWSSIQSQFQNKNKCSLEEEINFLGESRKQSVSGRTATAPVTPEELGHVLATSPSVIVGAEQGSLQPVSARTKKLTLEDFAFRSSAPVQDTVTRVGLRPKRSVVYTSEGKKADDLPRDQQAMSNNHSTLGMEEPISRLQPRTSSRLDSPTPFESMDAFPTPPLAKRRKLDKREVVMEDVVIMDEQEDDEPREVIATIQETVLWSSFQGTEAVIQASRNARVAMRKVRKELQSLKIARQSFSSLDQEATANGIDESVGVGNDKGNTRNSGKSALSHKGVVSLSKDDFRDMTVIGQFNLGFILAKCSKNHLWILDQHACDEKFNFERLCATTVIHEQKLIGPMPLELSPSEESCIVENMEIFEKNGFRFSYDPDKPPRHRLALTALPHSGAQDGRKAVQFGREDVTALCAILGAEGAEYSQDGGTGADGSGVYGNNAVRRYAGSISQSPGSVGQQAKGGGADNAIKVIARLPKAIAMFANRACRGSIMIGTALSQKEMETVVRRLADVEHPWNCPHGRPTMRHVRDLMGTLIDDEIKATEHVTGLAMNVMTQEAATFSQEFDEE